MGQLWGSLELVEPLAVVDLSTGGALIEGPAELPVESVHRLRLDTGSDTVDVQVRVAHARAVETANGTGLHRAGIEFLAVPESASTWLDTALSGPSSAASGGDDAADRSESSSRE